MVASRGQNLQASLSLFHPIVAEWFAGRYGEPTEVQSRGWPAIASGRHVLLSAPTGTGKTYAAFLFALNRLLTGEWESGTTRVLYVSPLKALNNDIRVNLLGPLEELRRFFVERGQVIAKIDVLTRSGDTPEAERRRMRRNPPEILITTPESLNIILSSPRSREGLSGVRAVILDEIHSLIAEKRGTHLMTAIERLVLLAGEFQRIGLSATVKPLAAAAEFLGGYRLAPGAGEPRYERRSVEAIESVESKRMELSVAYPKEAEARTGDDLGAPRADDTYWEIVARELCEVIGRRRSTLIFVNSRQLAERLAHLINEHSGRTLAYPHHGSLSRELRAVVERRLKEGELKAIVATSSLELGIDIGDLDEVILVQTPPGIAQAVQRVGRAGHSVGLVARGTIIPSHGMDLMRALVASDLVARRDIEESTPVICPLDVLAQVMISMTSVAPWKLDDLFAFLRTSCSYHPLTRTQFDLVIQMLEGRYMDSRIRELGPRVSVDRIEGIVRARDGARFLLYSSGGTIPDRGYYGLHVRGSDAKVGELDEEFVWERKVGDTFALGSQRWRIVAIDHQRVVVVPWQGSVNSAVFWRAEALNRSYHFSEAIGEYLERCEKALAHPAGQRAAAGESVRPVIPAPSSASMVTVMSLEAYLCRQRESTRAPLPHRHHLLIERSRGKDGVGYLILHTMWGGTLNQPLALALSALIRRSVTALDVIADNDTIVIVLPEELDRDEGIAALDVRELLGEIRDENLEELLAEELETSGYFGARFRESAGRALLLPKAHHGKRMPLWVTRLRAKRLLDRMRQYTDFPIVAESWRECIRDDFDLASLKRLLSELRSGEIQVSDVTTAAPSPFTAGAVWTSTGSYMYAGDAPGGSPRAGGASLSRGLLEEMVFSRELRIRIPKEAAEKFDAKLKRTAIGWSPHGARELIDWAKERSLIPRDEWRTVVEASAREGGTTPEELLRETQSRTALMGPAIVAIEERRRVERMLLDEEGPAELLREWLQYYGPIDQEWVYSFLRDCAAAAGASARGGSAPRTESGTDGGRLDRRLFENAVELLVGERAVVRDTLTDAAKGVELCDAENLERLLGFLRRELAPSFSPLPLEKLPLFLADWQGLRGANGEALPGEEGLRGMLERLFGFPEHAALWERDLFPARLGGYRRHWLDRLLADTELEWFGCGKERLSFRFRSDGDLFTNRGASRDGSEAADSSAGDPAPTAAGRRLALPEAGARYTFQDLRERSALSAQEFAAEVWRLVWKGRLLCDSFEPVRRMAAAGFRLERLGGVGSRGGQSAPARGANAFFGATHARRSGRWQTQAPLPGTWYTPPARSDGDLLDELETSKERVRLLLDRYGILFRELLARELPELHWSRLFKPLRLMELSGEVYAGVFFDSIPGLQFISHAALSRLREELREDAIYWMNATDPASISGVDLPIKQSWPSRLPSNHVVIHGSRVVLVSRRNCAWLDLYVEPGDPRLGKYFALFTALLERDVDPPSSIKVERINGIAVRESPYRHALLSFGFHEDFKVYSLWSAGGRAGAVGV